MQAAEFERRMLELVPSGQSPQKLTKEFEPSPNTIRKWAKQAEIGEGHRTDGLNTAERKDLHEFPTIRSRGGRRHWCAMTPSVASARTCGSHPGGTAQGRGRQVRRPGCAEEASKRRRPDGPPVACGDPRPRRRVTPSARFAGLEVGRLGSNLRFSSGRDCAGEGPAGPTARVRRRGE